MFRLVRADFYKVFRRPLFYVLLTALPALAAALVLIAIRGRGAGTLTGAFRVSLNLLDYPAALIPLVTELTLGEELRGRTVKNTLEAGIGRSACFCAKLISVLLLGALLLLAVLGVYFGTAALALPVGKGVSAEDAGGIFSRFGAAFAVYAAAAAMSAFLLALFDRGTFAIFAYYGGMYLTGLFLKVFRLDQLSRFLLSAQLSALTGEDAPRSGFILAVSAATFALFSAAGLAVFQRKDLA